MKNHILYLFTCILIFSSCTQRYWYRDKLNVFGKKRKPVAIRIVNLSPLYIDKEFEQEVEKSCIKRLRKEGYFATRGPSDVEFVLIVSVDTFIRGPVYYQGEGIRLMPGGERASYTNRGYLKEARFPLIRFQCTLEQLKPQRFIMWRNDNDMYFLRSRFRNMIRSKGMVKYMIRSADKR